MSEELNLDITELRRRRGRQGGRSGHDQNGGHAGPRPESRPGSTHFTGTGAPVTENGIADPAPAPIDIWRVLEVLLRRWSWVLLAAAVCGLIAFLVGLKVSNFTAKVSLIRRENPNAFTAGGGENVAPQAYLSRELSAQTLFGMMRSPEVFRRVTDKAVPPVRPERLAKAVRVVPERNPDFVTLTVSGKEPKEVLTAWANVLADEVVTYTKEIQANEAGSISEFLGLKVKGVQSELAHVNATMARFAEEAQTLDVDKEVEAYTAQVVAIDTKHDTARIELDTLDYQINNFRRALAEQTPGNNRLQAAQEELERLRMRGYTELHPEVRQQKAIVDSLTKQTAAAPAATALESRMPGGGLSSAIQLRILELHALKEVRSRELKEYESIKAKMQEKAKRLSKTAVEYAQLKAGQKRLEDLRVTLLNKQQEAQLLQENALGYFKVFAYASPHEVSARKRLFTVALLTGVGAALGFLVGCALALIAELMDRRIKTATDLERVSRLPVLATLGDLRKMSAEEQISWAFRTITLLQGKLNSSSDETLVCGFISSRHGEGRSTWINLLVSAASQRGMRVLTVATRPSTAPEEPAAKAAPKEPGLLPAITTTTLTKNVLASPAQVTEQFTDPQAQPVVHIPLPGWVWSLERRQQWRTALDHWQNIDNLVLLIELPPACEPESVLLAEHLPQVIWLASSGMADLEETRTQLETLRHARCNLVGAVLNREPSSFIRRHFGKWGRRLSLLLACGVLGAQAAAPGGASDGAPPASESATAAAQGSFSVVTPVKRAAWQQRLTLGPGDSFDLSVFGRPELTRTNIVVGPDGRVNYLQIQDFPVSGLTIDELRERLEAELSKFFVGGVRTIIVPAGFNSKKYFMLGKVVTEGVFTLDRPLTIIEAVARARGLQTGTSERGTAEIADLSRSFLAREGKRVPIDLERLFLQGDLSQNIPIEPNDYLYFAPAAVPEIYVLGEVLSPGRVVASSDATVVTAITARGGFTPRAYQKRVLVIRGSLQKPEGFAVDTPAILAGRTPDFRLEPKDIIYVNVRPWIRVEELLDIAAQAFIESAVTVWAGANVPAVFVRPIAPRL